MVDTKTLTPAIYASLAKVSEGMASIPKNGVMKGSSFSYQYLRADDVQERLNPLLTENNVIVRSDYTVTDIERGTRQFVYVNLCLDYVSALDGSSFPVRSVGESMASDDKSINKALTQAIKNAHRAMFQFSSGEPEPDDLGASGTATPTTASKTLDKARTVAAKVPAATPAPARTVASVVFPTREKVRMEYVEAGLISKDEANAAVELAKKKGLKDDALWQEVYKQVATLVHARTPEEAPVSENEAPF